MSYEMNEIRIFHADMKRAEKGTPAEKREAAYKFYEAMAGDPALVAERRRPRRSSSARRSRVRRTRRAARRFR